MSHPATAAAESEATACILCSRNCGIEVELDGRRLAKIRGDERHPISRGYLCQAGRLGRGRDDERVLAQRHDDSHALDRRAVGQLPRLGHLLGGVPRAPLDRPVREDDDGLVAK